MLIQTLLVAALGVGADIPPVPAQVDRPYYLDVWEHQAPTDDATGWAAVYDPTSMAKVTVICDLEGAGLALAVMDMEQEWTPGARIPVSFTIEGEEAGPFDGAVGEWRLDPVILVRADQEGRLGAVIERLRGTPDWGLFDVGYGDTGRRFSHVGVLQGLAHAGC